MKLLHNIGPRLNSNYNTPEEVAACEEPLSFDGIYLNVYTHRQLLAGKTGMLFVMGDYVGGDNSFDHGMPPENYCTWEQIHEIASVSGFEIGWHTWSHPDLTTVSDEQLRAEVTPPFPLKTFAYPYGRFDGRVIEAVMAAGFREAWSVDQGDDSLFQRRRSYLNW